MKKTVTLGVAGLGTVGVGVLKILEDQAAVSKTHLGADVQIRAVSARRRATDRGVDLSGYEWEDDPVNLAMRDDIDIFVELMGGSDGPAKTSVEAALQAGKHVVTANKALLAHHGWELAKLAETKGVGLRYEAAVAGGIPVIKSIQEALRGNNINRVFGVMNGSSNYILTQMAQSGLSYQEIFDQADALGYLEADPDLDVGGIDAAHKLAILAALCFGTKVDFEGLMIKGIQDITLKDLMAAKDMGFAIKLLGQAEATSEGLIQSVEPSLVPKTSILAQLEGGTNAIVLEGDHIGMLSLIGAGAGEGPTASAVVGDILDIARGNYLPVFGIPSRDLKDTPSLANSKKKTPYYIRSIVEDAPGVLAQVATALAKADVSIDRMRQPSHEGQNAWMLIVTHPAMRSQIDEAMSEMSGLSISIERPVAFPIIEF